MFLCLSKMRLEVLLSAGLIASMPSWAAAQTSAFTTIDISGEGTGVHQGTLATAINAAGDVAGIYIDGSGNQHAFLRTASGTITPFDASGSGGKNVETIPIGIDAAGDVAGIYLEPAVFTNYGQTKNGSPCAWLCAKRFEWRNHPYRRCRRRHRQYGRQPIHFASMAMGL